MDEIHHLQRTVSRHQVNLSVVLTDRQRCSSPAKAPGQPFEHDITLLALKQPRTGRSGRRMRTPPASITARTLTLCLTEFDGFSHCFASAPSVAREVVGIGEPKPGSPITRILLGLGLHRLEMR
jgi:hypothetical protein